MPRRLALLTATAQIQRAGSWQPIDTSVTGKTVVVMPTGPLRADAVEFLLTEQILSKLGGDPSSSVLSNLPARVVMAGRVVPAVALSGLTPRRTRTLLRRLGLDGAWIADARGVRFLPVVSDRVPTVRADDGQAVLEGLALPDLLARTAHGVLAVPDWTTSKRAGWVVGGPLGVECETCRSPLQWCDWWHVAAELRRNAWFAYCPEHGGPVRHHAGKSLLRLIQARRQLDSAMWAGSARGSARWCYVFDLQGLGPDHVYVGETALAPQERRAQHVDGILAAQILRKDGVTAGALRPDLIAGLPALSGREQALTAERWVAERLRCSGFKVHGGH